jgi:hypothetical protein
VRTRFKRRPRQHPPPRDAARHRSGSRSSSTGFERTAGLLRQSMPENRPACPAFESLVERPRCERAAHARPVFGYRSGPRRTTGASAGRAFRRRPSPVPHAWQRRLTSGRWSHAADGHRMRSSPPDLPPPHQRHRADGEPTATGAEALRASACLEKSASLVSSPV